ncbi:MAG: MoaD/ThiS family protein [Firmicutes bacterium]|nr:MoaD/ThiS family protein [Bacillota bacterium]
MIKIKLFGSLRLKTGCKGLEADSKDVRTIKEACVLMADTTGMTLAEYKNCVIMLNGKQAKISSKLSDGDELVFLAPSGGG